MGAKRQTSARGCKPGPDIEAPKTPSSPATAGRRPAKITKYCSMLKTKYCSMLKTKYCSMLKTKYCSMLKTRYCLYTKKAHVEL